MADVENVVVEEVLTLDDIEVGLDLTEVETALVAEYKNKVDLSDTNSIIQYGADAQAKLSEFSDTALERVKTKDLGAVSDSLTGLVAELQGFNALEERKGLAKLFKKAALPVEQLKNKYAKASTNVAKVVDVLDGHQVNLTRDIAVLDELFKANTDNYKELSLYIAAGKEKIEEARNTTLVELKAKAEASNDPQDIQAVNDFNQIIERFEKKVHDLNLTRTVAVQMAPQIRMLQNNDSLMIEKIQTALVNTIPLWKSQMVLALGLANSEEAVKAQRAVTDATNELLKKNAEALKQTTIGVAKESERGVIDLATLQETNMKLIETIDEVMKIQNEGREQRAIAETELQRLEGELKEKVLQTIS